MKKSVKIRFFSLAEKYSVTPTQKEVLWKQLEAAHTQKHRHYHTLSHLSQMLDLLDAHQDRVEYPERLAWTIWYHDVVYKSLRPDNEKQSAVQAQNDLNRILSHEDLDFVKNAILATQKHEPTQDRDLQFLLDFDLWILGQCPEMYQNYAKQIRREYQLVPDFLYKKGRKKVLQHFLTRPSIYQTAEFKKTYEGKARQNLENELAFLS